MNTKVLVISCESFSDSNSNGRTMKNMLLTLPRESIAQFYIHGIPDTEFCKNYFQISDHDALCAFLGRKTPVLQDNPTKISSGKVHKVSRNYRNLVLRDIVWQSKRWWTKEFNDFLMDFSPNIVLLQAGDLPFMYDIAIRISKAFNAKLIMFNTESYVLKKRMYASSSNSFFWHSLLMNRLKKQYYRFMRQADYCIYSMEALEKAYQEKYPHPGRSTTLYTVSELEELPDCEEKTFSLLYCGNLGVGRDKPLSELAKALYEVDKTAVLDIWGKFKDDKSQELVCKNPNVKFHGFCDYSEIPELMSRASMLIHCENNNRLEDLRYAFSTKIADCLASNRPFLVYASKEFPFVEYLSEHKAAHVASDAEELREILGECIKHKEYRYMYIKNARHIAKENHNWHNNCRKMTSILERLVPKPEDKE